MKSSTRLDPSHGWKLSQLLDELQRVHRDDVKLYTSGHLNPNKLFNPPRPTRFWSGSLGPISKRTVPKDQFDEKSAKMEDALSEFAIKTALVSDASDRPGFLKILDAQPQSGLLPSLPISDIALEQKLKEERKKLHDEMFKKDLKLPELRLLKYKTGKNSRQCLSSSRDEYQFISSYLSGVTKRDKFLKFLQFEKDVVAKQDLVESDFTGAKVAVSHEKKLEQELQKIHNNAPPEFNRLHVFGKIFEDICNSSLMFGDLLKEVKNEYELYMAILLDSQSSIQYKTLLAQVKGIEKRTVMTSDIEEARDEVKRLVKVAKGALERNEELRSELELEESLSKTPSAKSESPEIEGTEEKPLTLIEKIEEKRCEILNKWDAIYALEKTIKTNWAHAGIINITENSIKSIETEAIKLETVNGILKKKIMDSELKIKENLDRYKVSQEEQQKFWDFLDALIRSEEAEEYY
ncbi:uncharacterized protein C6orf118 homolog [Trichosurus vulpecula]|uniref:uncharacterized protein C6orf118 homolog n=1 Tax=Trichosurus vulpecula TaxID=9337 RepID=UPI00186ACE0A|nr:uncharacterized protein C6orf118 homolog [Trichosurus vulpecula]XP_036621738.1 uncharacterized protein C6orf118 homolog [Trichosurus vulpecula]